jgi:hypothetical protein
MRAPQAETAIRGNLIDVDEPLSLCLIYGLLAAVTGKTDAYT